MGYQVKVLFRDNLVSAGRNSDGAPVQGKQRVVGVITTGSGGYDNTDNTITPQQLGLTKIDYASFRVVDEVNAGSSTPDILYAGYDDSTNKLQVSTIAAAGTGTNEVANTTAVTIQFEAVGDSAQLVEQIV